MTQMQNRIVTTFMVGLLAAAIGIATGCSNAQREQQEKVLRQRYQDLATCLCKGDYDGCVKLTAPAVVKETGADKVLGLLKAAAEPVTTAKLTPDDMRIDKISFNADLTAAKLKTSYRIGGEWKPQKSVRWTLSDGQWYLAF